MKLFEFPIQALYMNYPGYMLSRGASHLLSVFSPVVYLLYKFGAVKY